jgi:hypothetical protein
LQVWGRRYRMCTLMVCRLISLRINCSPLRLLLEKFAASELSQGMFGIAKVVTDLFCQFRSFLPSFYILINYAFVPRFETIEAAERCIISLRRYRNLHPTFSNVCYVLMAASLFSHSELFRCSKSIRFPALPMHRVLFHLRPRLPVTSRVPPAAALPMDLREAH